MRRLTSTTGKTVGVALSRKNVEALLHMLDNRDKQKPALIGDGFIVEVQENDEHYEDREPGSMSWEETQ